MRTNKLNKLFTGEENVFRRILKYMVVKVTSLSVGIINAGLKKLKKCAILRPIYYSMWV